MDTIGPRPLIAAARVAAIYALASVVWILVTDELVGSLIASPELRVAASIAKGWGFVVVTGLLLFFTLRDEFGRRERVVLTLERYKALADNSHDIMLFIQESSGRILEANRAAVEAYGYDREELLQKTIFDLRHESTLGELDAQIRRANVAGARFETLHRRRDGSPFPVEVGAQGLTLGKDRLLVSVIRDISERKHAEAEQRRLAAERDRLLERLKELNAGLEQRVRERTADLLQTQEQLSQSEASLRALVQQRFEVQERERAYVADQLYNEAAQVLAAVQIQQARLGRELAQNQGHASQELWADLNSMVDRVLGELHHLAVHLRPATLDRLGLAPAIEQYLAEVGREHGLSVKFIATGIDGTTVPTEIATALYRIMQEALANVVQHARADNVSMVIACSGAQLSIVLEDDGVGFDVEEAARRGGLGLVGMRERVHALDGCLEVESRPGASGTTIVVDVPLAKTS